MARVNANRSKNKIRLVTKGLVQSTGNIVSHGAKWFAQDHAGTGSHLSEHTRLTHLEQEINYSEAKCNLTQRKIDSALRYERLVQYGKLASTVIVAFDWLIDRIQFCIELVCGFLNPLLRLFVWSLFRVLVIAALNIIFFGTLVFLIFH